MSGLRAGADWRPHVAWLLVVAVLSACGDRMALDHETIPGGSAPTGSSDVHPGKALPRLGNLVERAGPAVVSIVTTRSPSFQSDFAESESRGDSLQEFFQRLVPELPEGEELEFRGKELGSGFVISPDGYILTSAHVVVGGEEVVVRFPDRDRELAARLVGIDRNTDVALLKVDEPTPQVVELGASKDLRVGDWVAAIGSPFGFSNTITAGIVSATRRPLPNEPFVSFIQTDVAVNPGSSGGPLVNLKGEVVGINSMIYSRTGGYMGVSFAIPIEAALDVSEQLRKHGHVTRGRIGVQTQALTEKLARSFKTPTAHGVLVTAIEPAGPAAGADLQVGDVILEYAGTRVESVEELSRLVAKSIPGRTSTLEVWRNGEHRTMSVAVGEVPAEKRVASAPARESTANRLGLVMRDLPAAQRHELGIEHGLLVENAQGAANVSGLQPGDVITTFNHTPLVSRKQFNQLLAAQESGSMIALRILRGPVAAYVAVKVPEG